MNKQQAMNLKVGDRIKYGDCCGVVNMVGYTGFDVVWDDDALSRWFDYACAENIEKDTSIKVTYFAKQLIIAGFSREQIEKVIEVREATCNVCWDAPAGCQCWNGA